MFRISNTFKEKVPFVLNFSWWQMKMKETLCWNVILATSELCTVLRQSFFPPASLSSLSLYCGRVFLSFPVSPQYWFFTLFRLRLDNKRGSLLGKNVTFLCVWTYRRSSLQQVSVPASAQDRFQGVGDKYCITQTFGYAASINVVCLTFSCRRIDGMMRQTNEWKVVRLLGLLLLSVQADWLL